MDRIYEMIDRLFRKKEYTYIQENIIIIYYEIGKYIVENNYNIFNIEDNLRKRYGLIIGFTKRNIKNMIKFYNLYKEENVDKLKKISWDNHLLIMKCDNKKELINYCVMYNIDKYSLKKIIKYGFDKKYINKEKLKNDIVTLEIMQIIGSKSA